MVSAEVLQVLTPALLTVGLLAIGAIGAWLKMKTVQWERMTRNAAEDSARAVANTQITQDLVRENTELTRQAAVNSNGALERLERSQQRAQELRVRMQERIADEPDSQLKDDLDEMSDAFQKKEIKASKDGVKDDTDKS